MKRASFVLTLLSMTVGLSFPPFGVNKSLTARAQDRAPARERGQDEEGAEVEPPQIDLRARELSAPRQVRDGLARRRRELRRKGLGYEIGLTSVSNKRIPRLRNDPDERRRTPESRLRQNEEARQIIEREKIPTVEEIMSGRGEPPAHSSPPLNQGNNFLAAGARAPRTSNCASRRRFEYTRGRGEVPPIRDQGSCGSCWAFAGAALVDSSYRIRHGRASNVSEQELIDCAGRPADAWVDGCEGFYIESTMLHMQLNGVAWENRYRYTGRDGGTCRNPPYSYKVSTWGWVGLGWASKDEIKEALCRYGPVATTIDVTDDFKDYTGGVFSEKPRSRYGPVPFNNHAVLIVGWDDDKGAWRVRNSWGTGWGENGSAWVKYNHNGIGWDTVWAVAKK